ncbi:MAG: hypothetical protein ACI828_002608 [Flavobacteriales bacterium]|jgi:hypothetical protein
MIKTTFKILGVLAVLTILLVSCERDDICAESTPTTALLIIRFYDADNPTEFKAASDLVVAEVGASTGLIFTGDSIAIPLRTDIDITTYRFTNNANADIDADNPPNEDLINFDYIRTEEYVSKACGFRSLYEQLGIARDGQDDGSWIRELIIDNTSVNDATAAHIRIFH